MHKVNTHSLKEKLFYAFDNSLSKGTVNIILWLVFVLTGVVLSMAFLVWFTGASLEESLISQIWFFTKTILIDYPDASNEALIFNLVMFVLFITGLLVSGALIGALTTGLSDKLAEIRGGYSKVIETGHTVILGWSSHLFSIIKELDTANENQNYSCVVVLGRKSKQEMSTEIQKNVISTGHTRIICRQGDRRSQIDLSQLSLDTAKSIIINQHSHVPSDVAKTLLAIINRPERKQDPFHIVAVVESEADEQIAKIIGKKEVEIIRTRNFLARLEAQTCRQSGLPYVYHEILNFAGDEIYFQEETKLVGRSYSDALSAYRNSAVIGVFSINGEIVLNPPMHTGIKENDKIIAISEDDDTIILDEPDNLDINERAIKDQGASTEDPENFLIWGWNTNTATVLIHLDEYVMAGSSAKVIVQNSSAEEEIIELRNILSNMTLDLEYKNFSERKILEQIEYHKFDHVLIEGDESIDIQEADTITVSTLLHLRDIRDKKNYNFPITTEIFDSTNYDLIQSVKTDDFIIGENIISAAVAQIAENKLLARIFDELFRPEGSEIYLKPAQDYVALDENINFYTVLESARRKGETALGYRLNRFSRIKSELVGKKEMNYGVLLNPEKTGRFEFTVDDSIIVLSES